MQNVIRQLIGGIAALAYLAALFFVAAAAAQAPPQAPVPPAKLALFDTWQLVAWHGAPADGWGIYTSPAAAGTSANDSAWVYVGRSERPLVVRAVISDTLWARTLTAGTFAVGGALDAALRAHRADTTFRRRLVALYDDQIIIDTLRTRHPPGN